jgi:nucleoside 2-deoxyribosyltransferase
MKIYIIGSLRNPKIPEFANTLTKEGYEVFADWFAPGPEADDFWRNYSKARGWTYKQALRSHAARNIFEFDKKHLEEADVAIMLMPAGKSGHIELGYHVRSGKPGYILFDEEPERYDVMVQFATDIFFSQDELLAELKKWKAPEQELRVYPGMRWPRSL